MTLSLQGIIILLIIAAVCGAVAKALVGVGRGGLITSIALGFIGALIGPWLAGQLGLSEPFMLKIGGESFPILWSIIGAALFIALLHLLTGRGGRR
ncbi:MAG: GlsB/YeaQ/YmgE family stress response membrane protein [Vicinamibacterales bacterium]